jgi:hypothetical protein
VINEPLTVIEDGFQQAWGQAVHALSRSGWELRNLVVHIRNPGLLNVEFNENITEFARGTGLLPPKHVAYTIFPHGLWRNGREATALFNCYNRPGGMFERLHRRKRDWGTYFRRMTNYERDHQVVNQLENIIHAIQNRDHLHKAAYTILIQKPGGETIRPLGGPCLNYLAIQAEPQDPPRFGLLAIYRNHDFRERAYGNYWGLCNLLGFIAAAVNGTAGPVTCISSHAFVDTGRTALKALVDTLS